MVEWSRARYAARCGIAASLVMIPPTAAGTRESPIRVSPAQIAFASHRDGNWEIYVADADGKQQTRLTRRDPQDRFPLWSPDRSKLAFGSQVGGDHWELWVMNADGSSPRFLAAQIVAKGSRQWSHDGRRIVFSAKVDDDIEIFSVEVASGRLTRLTNSPGDDSDPTWSPDDGRIAFSSTRDGNSEIYVMRADGSDAHRATNNAALDRSPAWSPDGSRIAFVSARAGDRDIYIARVDDGRVERLTTSARSTNDPLRWSPDGSTIAIQTTDGGYDIQLVRVADKERKTVAGSPTYDGQFSWSPSSDQLVFISGRDGFNGVYVTDLAGKQRRLTSTPSLDPQWSP